MRNENQNSIRANPSGAIVITTVLTVFGISLAESVLAALLICII